MALIIKKRHEIIDELIVNLSSLNCLQEALLNPNGIALTSRKIKIIPV